MKTLELMKLIDKGEKVYVKFRERFSDIVLVTGYKVLHYKHCHTKEVRFDFESKPSVNEYTHKLYDDGNNTYWVYNELYHIIPQRDNKYTVEDVRELFKRFYKDINDDERDYVLHISEEGIELDLDKWLNRNVY